MQKAQVLFVDDDERLLAGLRRMLHRCRDVWDMHFCTSGAQALDLFAEMAIDVIVSDMRMPGMDGAELLSNIQRIQPGVTRLILSGYSELDVVFKTIGPSHQYLAKPCDAEQVQKTISLALRLKDVVKKDEVRDAIGGITSLPILPHSANELSSVLGAKSLNLSLISSVIHKDLCLAAQIMKLTNSSYFLISPNVQGLAQALETLGADTLRSIIGAKSFLMPFDGSPQKLSVLKNLNKRAQLGANLAANICRVADLGDAAVDNAYAAALLMDIGRIFLAIEFPERFDKCQSICEVSDQTRTDVEIQVFGASHSDIGSYLLGLWGFREDFINIIENHRHFDGFTEPLTVKSVVQFASAALDCHESTFREETEVSADEFFKKFYAHPFERQILEFCESAFREYDHGPS